MNNNAKLILRMWLTTQPVDKPVIKFPNCTRDPRHGTVEVYPHDLLELIDEADEANFITEKNFRDL